MQTGDGTNSFQKFVDFYRSDKLFQDRIEPKEQQSKMQTIIRQQEMIEKS